MSICQNEVLIEERQLMKWVEMFQVGIFWVGIFQGGSLMGGNFPGGDFPRTEFSIMMKLCATVTASFE